MTSGSLWDLSIKMRLVEVVLKKAVVARDLFNLGDRTREHFTGIIGIIGIEPNRTEQNRTEPIWFVFGLWDHVFRIPHQILCPVHQTGAQTDRSRIIWCQKIKNMIFRKRCAPRLHAECTGRCVEIFHEEPIREKNVIFKKVASWYPGIPVTDPW